MQPGTVAIVLAAAVAHAVWNLASKYKRGDTLLFVCAYILVVTGNPFRSGSRRPLQGMLWGAATGATIAGYTLWDSFSVTSLHLAPVSYYASTAAVEVI